MNITEKKSKKDGSKSYQVFLMNATARYPWLNEPSTKFVKEKKDAKYETGLLYNGESATVQELEAYFRPVMEAFAQEQDLPPAKAKRVKIRPVFRDEEDKETGELTGNVFVNAKTRAYMDDPQKGLVAVPFPLIGRDKQPFTDRVYGGSIINAKVVFRPYFSPTDEEVGMACYLTAVQVMKAAQGSFDATSGFDSYDDEEDESEGQTTTSTAKGKDPF